MRDFIKGSTVYGDVPVEKVNESLKTIIERKICLECKSKKCSYGNCKKINSINCKHCKHFVGCEKVCGGVKYCEDFEYVKR